MKKLGAAVLLSAIFSYLWIGEAHAEDDENYESIVNRLSHSAPALTQETGLDPFAALRIHGGAGFAQSVTQFLDDSGDFRYLAQRGIQVAIGVDLFSPRWIAEGAIVNFGESVIDDQRVSLREFNLRVFYHNRTEGLWSYTLGGGFAARYLNISNLENLQPAQNREFSTPSAILFTGLMARLNPNVTVTTELATRSAMIDETQDKSAVNLTFRLDTHF